MSRIGRLPVAVPASVQNVNINDRTVTVTGPKGELSHALPAGINAERAEDGSIIVSRTDEERETRGLHGLTRTLIANMIEGVTNGFTKKLEIVGTGYRVTAKGQDLEFALGFSHPVTIKPPQGISFAVETPTKFSVSGIDKQQVGEMAAKIRKLRKPEPYKGKGVRYAGETILRKAGKAGK